MVSLKRQDAQSRKIQVGGLRMEGLRLRSPTLPRRRERRLLGDDIPAKLMAAGFQIRIRTTTSRLAPAASIMGAMGARC